MSVRVFRKDYTSIPAFNVKNVLTQIPKASVPLLLVSAPGFDPSGSVWEYPGGHLFEIPHYFLSLLKVVNSGNVLVG